MKLSRRVVIRNIAVGMAGYVLLPSCSGNPGQSLLEASAKLGLNADDEASIAALCRIILPLKAVGGEMENPGLHPFVLRMVADCQAPENRERYKKGLRKFIEKVISKTGHSIEKSKAADLFAIVTETEALKDKEDDLSFFYRLTKNLTMQGYTGSKFYLTQVRPYVLVPGKYQGCVTR